MTKDYKNTPKHDVRAKKSKPKKAATRKSRAIPAWLWLVTGAAIGGFAAFLFYLQNSPVKTAKKPVPEVHVEKPEKVAPKPPAAIVVKPEKPKFEFYTILPEQEVVVPDIQAKKSTHKATTVETDDAGRYLLQSGSFRRFEDADKRKAMLALLGVQSSIQKVTINENEVWHRVRLGPYHDIKELNDVRAILRKNNIETLLIKVKG